MCKCTWALNFRISDNVVSGVQTLQRLQSRTIVKRAGYGDSRSASTRALARECVLLLENVFSYLGMCSIVLDMEILVVHLLGHRLLDLVVVYCKNAEGTSHLMSVSQDLNSKP